MLPKGLCLLLGIVLSGGCLTTKTSPDFAFTPEWSQQIENNSEKAREFQARMERIGPNAPYARPAAEDGNGRRASNVGTWSGMHISGKSLGKAILCGHH